MAAWRQLVRRIVDGEAVDAPTTNRPVTDLINRTDYLKEAMDALQAGQALVDTDAQLTAETFVGCPVYWDADLGAYAPALAEFSVADDGTVTPAARSRCLGVVLSKSTTTVGAVGLAGRVEGVDVSLATGADPAPGTYYLSATEAGMLVSERPQFAVPVLSLASATSIWLGASGQGNAYEHQHRHFVLSDDPAGEINEPDLGDPYEFASTWTDVPGWLPAEAELFPDLTIPAGAAFGYNLTADGPLAAVWPPTVLESVRIYQDGLLLRPEQCVINSDGIWWMTNCPGSVPFSVGDSSAAEETCPPTYTTERVELVFTDPLAVTDDSFVVSLQGSGPVEVVNCNTGMAARRGNLLVRLADLVESVLATGGVVPDQAVVELDRTTKYVAPHVGGVRGTGRVGVSGTGTAYVDSAGRRFETGGISLSLSDEAEFREGGVDLIELNNVGETSTNGVFYHTMPSGVPTSMRGRISVPLSYVPDNAALKLYITVLSSDGSDPSLDLTYRVLPYPAAVLADYAEDSDGSLTSSGDFDGANSYRVEVSNEIEVTAGSLVFFTLSNDGGAEVGVINMRWRITEASA